MQPSEEIKNKLDIVDFIKDYIPLYAAGMNFRARCPFHNEKTPSFMVSPDKQIWHCFGCGKGGDIFKFLMEMEGIEFVEALRILAPKAGVILKRQDPKLASERTRLLDIIDISRRFYHKYLLESPNAESARKYLAGRGLDGDTIEEWQIGYSPESWDELLKILKKQGYRDAEILKTGMTIHNQQRNSYYDRFRGRIMFPICDVNGNFVAFSARVSPEKEATETMGKYINSPQTTLYNKSKILFGLDKAKQAIKQNDQVIVVEGQMDVISAHQNGYKNVVASSGTALTTDQISMLKRYSANFALAFDMDDAGHMAADRGIREALKQSINISVIEVPEGKDPDECIKNDREAWERAVNEAKHMMEYYFDRTFSDLDLARIVNRRKAAAFLLPVIASMEDKIERSHWLKALAETIGVEEAVLYESIANESKKQTSPDKTELESKATALKTRTREEQVEDLFLALLIRNFDMMDYIIKSAVPESIASASNSGIYKNLIMYYNTGNQKDILRPEGNALDLDEFLEWLKSNISTISGEEKTHKNKIDDQLEMLQRLVLLGDKEFFDFSYEDSKKELIRLNILLKKTYYLRKMKEMERGIADAEKKGNEARALELLTEIKQVGEKLRDLNK